MYHMKFQSYACSFYHQSLSCASKGWACSSSPAPQLATRFDNAVHLMLHPISQRWVWLLFLTQSLMTLIAPTVISQWFLIFRRIWPVISIFSMNVNVYLQDVESKPRVFIDQICKRCCWSNVLWKLRLSKAWSKSLPRCYYVSFRFIYEELISKCTSLICGHFMTEQCKGHHLSCQIP